jgi:hypothetical protein
VLDVPVVLESVVDAVLVQTLYWYIGATTMRLRAVTEQKPIG